MRITGIQRHQIAFTLVEIMIAIAIFSLTMIAIYSSWSMIVNGRRIGMKAAEDAQRSRMTLRSIESALFGARMFQQNAHHQAFLADTTDPEFASLSFVSYLPRSFPGSGLFGYQPLRRVSFVVEDGRQNRGKNLVLLQTPMLQPLEESEEPVRIVLAENIALFTLEFWDPVNQEWMDEWVLTNELPQQVNVGLALKSEEGNKVHSVDMRAVSIPSMTIPPQYQMPAAGPRQPGLGDPNQPPTNAPPGEVPGTGDVPVPGNDPRQPRP